MLIVGHIVLNQPKRSESLIANTSYNNTHYNVFNFLFFSNILLGPKILVIGKFEKLFNWNIFNPVKQPWPGGNDDDEKNE